MSRTNPYIIWTDSDRQGKTCNHAIHIIYMSVRESHSQGQEDYEVLFGFFEWGRGGGSSNTQKCIHSPECVTVREDKGGRPTVQFDMDVLLLSLWYHQGKCHQRERDLFLPLIWEQDLPSCTPSYCYMLLSLLCPYKGVNYMRKTEQSHPELNRALWVFVQNDPRYSLGVA